MGRVAVDLGVGQGAKRSVDIRSDLGQASNAGQRQNQRNRRRREAEGQLAASLGRYSPLKGDAPLSLLAIRPSASTRDPSQSFNSLLGASGVNRRTSALERGPLDNAALGVVFGHFSNDLQESQQRAQPLGLTAGVQQHETVVEFTYRFAFIRSALYFRPDLQYIIRPGGTGRIPNALALGAQVGVNF